MSEKTSNGVFRPYYAWYPRDFALNERVAAMTLEEEGAYRRLLDHQWLHGSIPADLGAIAAICKNISASRMKKLWVRLEPCFSVMAWDPTRLTNRRLELERAITEEKLARQVERGKRGAAIRWNRTTGSTAEAVESASRDHDTGNGQPNSIGMLTNGHAEAHSEAKENRVAARFSDDGFTAAAQLLDGLKKFRSPTHPNNISAEGWQSVSQTDRKALQLAGGIERLLTCTPRDWSFLVKEFVKVRRTLGDNYQGVDARP